MISKDMLFLRTARTSFLREMMMNYRMLSLNAIAWSLSGIVLVASTFAQDEAKTSSRPHSQQADSAVEIPACLNGLSLTTEQQEEIKRIVRDHDDDLAAVWKQFGTSYLSSVRTEAMLLIAIEDNLTTEQRKQVREQRRKTAGHQESLAGTGDKPNQSTTSSVDAVEDEVGMVRIPLTAEQEAAADRLQAQCLGQLRSLNRDIGGLHVRLVSLEADKLVEIESVLTKEQQSQWRDNRQNSPTITKVSAKATPASSK